MPARQSEHTDIWMGQLLLGAYLLQWCTVAYVHMHGGCDVQGDCNANKHFFA
jgi:hypothetical protein